MLRPGRAMQSPRRGRLARDAVVACAFTAATAAISAALLAAAALVPAPAAALPLVAIVALGCPMLAVLDSACWIGPRRRPGAGDRPRARRQALEDLRRALARLPETRHPLGL